MVENQTLLQDRYLIEKKIGAGGMGAVYLAVDRRFDSYVAIKETFYTDEELRAAFEREARLLNGLNHPALPHVSDYFAENNRYFLVMQYIEGEDLFEILKREGAFAFEKVEDWTIRLLDALDFLHSQKTPIIHRDVKPQNLKLTPRGEVILLDFGLAKLNSDESSSVKSVFGYSRKYSPLEQIQGTGTDARSDIFSLAATAYHLLTGKPPVDVLARASEIIAGHADPLIPVNESNDKIPDYFAAALQKGLALDAKQRFDSAGAMRDALVNKTNLKEADKIPVETIGFPALNAFAAVNVNDSVKTTVEPIEISENSIKKTNDSPYQTNVEPKVKKRSRLPLIAAAMLAAVLLASGFFALRRPASGDENQIPTVQQPAETNGNVADATQTSVNADVSETNKSVDDSAASANREIEIADKSDANTAVKAKPPINNPQTRQTPSKNRQPNPVSGENGDTRERVVEDKPITEDEPPTRRRTDRRRDGDVIDESELTDEEYRELIRERRQRQRQRRERRNRQPPF